MAASTKPSETYPFMRDFEMCVVLAEVSAQRFHEVIGHALNAEMLPSEPARLLVSAGQAVAKETGTGCSSPVSAVQHLRFLCDRGKLTHAQVQIASDFIDTAKDLGGVLDLNELISQVTPIVQRLEHREALNAAIKDFGQGDGVEDTVERMERIAGLGKQRVTCGFMLPKTEREFVTAMQSGCNEILSTGVVELDRILDGGLERPSLGTILGGTGSGKSLFLSSLGAAAMVNAYSVAYATLELPVKDVSDRTFMNLLDATEESLRTSPEKYARRLSLLRETGLGGLCISHFNPQDTVPADLRSWLRLCENEHGFRPDILIVDYADKMLHRRGPKAKETSAYKEMEYVYEALHGIGTDLNCWVWTASQTNRGGMHNKFVDIEHASDSMNKARVADLVLAIARTHADEAEGMIRFRVPKRRRGVAHGEVGPIPMDAAHGRITMFNRPAPWDKK
jgi:DnaB-like helicase C terminal domain